MGLTVVGLVCLGLVLSCLLMSFLILSCWWVDRDGETKASDRSGKRGAWAAVTRGEDQDRVLPIPLRTQGMFWTSDVRSAAGKAGARMSSLAKAVIDKKISLDLSSKGARFSGVRSREVCMQEANDKTGAAGKRGALVGPEAWLERGGREGVDEDDRQQKDEDEKRKQSEDER